MLLAFTLARLVLFSSVIAELISAAGDHHYTRASNARREMQRRKAHITGSSKSSKRDSRFHRHPHGCGNTEVCDPEFVYSQNQDEVHLTTIEDISVAEFPLGGDLRCTFDGLCQGIGRYSIAGEWVPPDNAGGDATLHVEVGGPTTANPYHPSGDLDTATATAPTFQFTCPLSSQSVAAVGGLTQNSCTCMDKTNGNCNLVLTNGNPATVAYDPADPCTDGFWGDIELTCT